MKKALNDLKSFVTVAMIIILAIIVIADLFNRTISDNLLILVTNLITAVFTYYFTRKNEDKKESDSNDNNI